MTTLKSLVDETTNIKNEIVECHKDLMIALISKNIEATQEDKFSDLINKIKNINLGSKKVIGSVVQDSRMKNFCRTNGAYSDENYITISNLGFNPSVVVATCSGKWVFLCFDTVLSCWEMSSATPIAFTTYNVYEEGYIDIPTWYANTGKTFNFIAIE